MEKFKFIVKNKISDLPKSTGVYCFKKCRELFYIGKATNIQDRVRNHFQRPASLWEQALNKGTFLRQKASAFADRSRLRPTKVGGQGKIGYIKTDSEIEALILEANLIKKYQPKYNIIWRDDKNFFYIGITKEDFPQVFWTHQIIRVIPRSYPRKSASKVPMVIQYIGPFVDGKALKATLKSLRKVFPYRSCKTFPKPRTKAKLGAGLVQNRSEASGSGRPCLWYQLDRCPAPCLLRTDLAKQIPLSHSKMKKECQENAKNLVTILQGKKKQVLKNLKKSMKKASVTQDFEKAAKIRDQIEALEKTISHTGILVEPLEILEKEKKDWSQIQKDLQGLLKTKKKISRIEAYDISNIQGFIATGSMVTFVNGKPDKNFYRKFKIKYAKSARSRAHKRYVLRSRNAAAPMRIERPNDIAMIKEILSRRLAHPEWPYPNIILIDGGRAQLNAALQCLTSGFKHILVIALAKKKKELYLKDRKNPILLKTLPRPIFNLILQLRDEAHRFAITYHRKLRRKALIG